MTDFITEAKYEQSSDRIYFYGKLTGRPVASIGTMFLYREAFGKGAAEDKSNFYHFIADAINEKLQREKEPQVSERDKILSMVEEEERNWFASIPEVVYSYGAAERREVCKAVIKEVFAGLRSRIEALDKTEKA